jgi:hypothetical protein
MPRWNGNGPNVSLNRYPVPEHVACSNEALGTPPWPNINLRRSLPTRVVSYVGHSRVLPLLLGTHEQLVWGFPLPKSA